MLAMIVTAVVSGAMHRHFEILAGPDIDYEAQTIAFRNWVLDIIPTREERTSTGPVEFFKDVPF